MDINFIDQGFLIATSILVICIYWIARIDRCSYAMFSCSLCCMSSFCSIVLNHSSVSKQVVEQQC